MGTRIIQQPDGKFGLFSTISDRIWAVDCTEAEMIRIWRDRAAASAEKEMREWLEEVKDKERNWRSSSMTLGEALKGHRFHKPGLAEKHPEYAGEVEFDEEVRKLKTKKEPEPEDDE